MLFTDTTREEATAPLPLSQQLQQLLLLLLLTPGELGILPLANAAPLASGEIQPQRRKRAGRTQVEHGG